MLRTRQYYHISRQRKDRCSVRIGAALLRESCRMISRREETITLGAVRPFYAERNQFWAR